MIHPFYSKEENMKQIFIVASMLAATTVLAQEGAEKSFIVRVTSPSRKTIAETIVETGSMVSPAVVSMLPKVGGRLVSTTLADGTDVTEGTAVKKGDVIAQIESTDYAARLAASQASLDYAKATLDDAQKEFDRTAALLKENTATEQEADKALAELLRAKASLKQAEANLALARLDMEETQVHAPMDGRISAKHAYPGAMLSPSTPLFTLTAMDPLKLFFDLPTTAFAKIKPGTTDVAVKVDAYPDEILKLKIHSVHPSANDATRTVRIELHVANTDGKYLPGMYAKGEVALNKRDNVLVVPRECIITTLSKNLVYKIKDGRAVSTEVKLGTRFDDVVEILDGMTDGDVIVFMGHQRLTDGVSVSIEK